MRRWPFLWRNPYESALPGSTPPWCGPRQESLSVLRSHQGDPSPRGDVERAAGGHRHDCRRLPGRRPAPDRRGRLHGEHRGDRPGQRARGRPDRGHRPTGRRPQRHQRQHRRGPGEGPPVAAIAAAKAAAKARREAAEKAARDKARKALEAKKQAILANAQKDPRAAARALLADFGFDESQWSCLDNLWHGRERLALHRRELLLRRLRHPAVPARPPRWRPSARTTAPTRSPRSRGACSTSRAPTAPRAAPGAPGRAARRTGTEPPSR